MVKRSVFSLLTALALVLTLLPGTALAEDYAAWSDDSSLPSTSGYYRLETDVTLTQETTLRGTVVLDLNGHTVFVQARQGYFLNSASASLTVEDRSADGDGRITNEDCGYSTSTLIFVNNGNFALTGGTLENTTMGYGVQINASASGEMTEGKIVSSGSSGSALFLNSTSSFTMEGGTLANTGSSGTALFVNSDAGFTMEGGTISNSVNGGNCVYVNTRATFTMTDGLLEQEGAYSNDAAIYSNGTGTIAIGGGAVTSAGVGVYAASAPVEVTGGSFETDSYAFQTRYTTIDPADEDVSVQSGAGIFYAFRGSENEIAGGQFDAPPAGEGVHHGRPQHPHHHRGRL